MSFLLQQLAGGNATAKKMNAASASMKKRLQTNAYGSTDFTSLGTSGLQQAVKLPKNESKNEWLAVHVVGTFHLLRS